MAKFVAEKAIQEPQWYGHEPLAAVCEFAGLSRRQALCVLMHIGMDMHPEGMAHLLSAKDESEVTEKQVRKVLRGAYARVREAKGKDYEEARKEKEDLLYCINSNGKSTSGSQPLTDEWGNPVHLHPFLVTADDLLDDGGWIKAYWDKSEEEF